MRIGIDYRSALYGGAGIGRYARELCRCLPSCLDEGEEAVLFSVSLKKSRAPCLEDWSDVPRTRMVRRRFPGRALHLLGRLNLLSVETFTGPMDLFHYTDFVYPPLKGTPYSLMLFDLVFMHGKGYHSLSFERSVTRRVRAALGGARGVVVPSNAVLEDLRSFFPGLKGAVKVIPLGSDHLVPHDDPLESGLPPSGRYILSVGTLEPRKNRINLLKAFEDVARAIPWLELAVAGRPGWMDATFRKRLQESPFRERVRLFLDIDDKKLSLLYRNALALVYPSFREGFGLPVAEAMALGCPVITSDRSSMPEVAKGAARLVNPDEVHEMAEAIRRLALDAPAREALARAGRKRARELTWKKTAEQTMEFLRELAGRKEGG